MQLTLVTSAIFCFAIYLNVPELFDSRIQTVRFFPNTSREHMNWLLSRSLTIFRRSPCVGRRTLTQCPSFDPFLASTSKFHSNSLTTFSAGPCAKATSHYQPDHTGTQIYARSLRPLQLQTLVLPIADPDISLGYYIAISAFNLFHFDSPNIRIPSFFFFSISSLHQTS